MTNWLIGGLIIITVGIGGFFVLGTNDKGVMMEDSMPEKAMMPDSMQKEDSMKDDTMMEKDDSMMKDDAMMQKDGMMGKGSYEPYASSKLAKADSGDVVLFFRAAWCPTCKVLDADLRAQSANIPAGLTILDVDYDTETALKQKYGVTYQHTLVQVDAQGKMITKWSGGQNLASIVANVR